MAEAVLGLAIGGGTKKSKACPAISSTGHINKKSAGARYINHFDCIDFYFQWLGHIAGKKCQFKAKKSFIKPGTATTICVRPAILSYYLFRCHGWGRMKWRTKNEAIHPHHRHGRRRPG